MEKKMRAEEPKTNSRSMGWGQGLQAGRGPRQKLERQRQELKRSLVSFLSHLVSEFDIAQTALILNIPLLSSKQLQNPMAKTHTSPHILPLSVTFCNLRFILFPNVIINPYCSSIKRQSDLTVWQSTGGMQIINKELITQKFWSPYRITAVQI